jgi:hypothetical protein
VACINATHEELAHACVHALSSAPSSASQVQLIAGAGANAHVCNHTLLARCCDACVTCSAPLLYERQIFCALVVHSCRPLPLKPLPCLCDLACPRNSAALIAAHISLRF